MKISRCVYCENSVLLGIIHYIVDRAWVVAWTMSLIIFNHLYITWACLFREVFDITYLLTNVRCPQKDYWDATSRTGYNNWIICVLSGSVVLQEIAQHVTMCNIHTQCKNCYLFTHDQNCPPHVLHNCIYHCQHLSWCSVRKQWRCSLWRGAIMQFVFLEYIWIISILTFDTYMIQQLWMW